MKTTRYFREQVLRKRPYIRIEWCKRVLANPLAQATQPDGRIRFWGMIEEFDGRCLAGRDAFRRRDRSQRISGSEFSACFDPGEIAMKLNYDQESDSLYIDLNARPGVDSREIQAARSSSL